MNQIVIDVELTVIGETDVLIFKIDEDNPDEYLIDLNSESSQTQIKKVFSKLLETLIDNELSLNFIITDGYSKKLYIDVCREYVCDLNSEISNVKEQIKAKL